MRLVPPGAAAMDILVAEDDRDIAELISHYLKKAGWAPHVVEAGDQALAYLRNHPVDVVIGRCGSETEANGAERAHVRQPHRFEHMRWLERAR